MLPGSGGQAHNRDLTQMRHDTRLKFGTLIVAASAGLLLAACGPAEPDAAPRSAPAPAQAEALAPWGGLVDEAAARDR